MDHFSFLGASGHMAMLTVVGFLFVLTVVVFFHELGHFLVARWCGVAVRTFSIGFGPEIFGFNDRHGTRWRVSWIPLGGYVKFIDDDNVASAQAGGKALEHLSAQERKHSFQGKSVAQRAAIVAAGPVANFILAILIFTGLFTFFGEQTTEARVDVVTPGSVAEKAGFLPGDRVVSIDGHAISDFGEMQRIVRVSAGTTLHFALDRGGKRIEVDAAPQLKEMPDGFGNTVEVGQLGIQRNAPAAEWTTKRHDPLTAFKMAVQRCYTIVETSLAYLAKVVTGRASADQLGGPMRIAQISGQVASLGLLPLVDLVGVLSVSIGFINLFPIPMLDGGHLLFYGIEGIRGKPLSESTQEIGFRIGLAFVLMLMIFATWNDLIHLKFL
jgi:regulator of sigma E protease